MTNLTIVQNGQAVTTSRMVAEKFGKEHRHVLESIREILTVENSAVNFFLESTYENERGRLYPEYLMNRDGFTLLAMGFTGADAMQWKIKYIQAFNEMEKQLSKPLPQMSQMEIIAAIAQGAAEHEKQLKQIEQAQIKQAEELQGIRDVVSLNTINWREDAKNIITKIADKMGGFEHIQTVRKESYKQLNSRINVDIDRRLKNKRQRMADEGVCKSKRDKINYLDIIAEDKKLLEAYLAIIKEMAIRSGVTN